MKKITTVVFALFLFILSNCATEKKTEPILGDWQAIGWLVDGKDSNRDISSISFAFKTDGNYQANWGEQGEKGTFEVKGDKLYTTGEGQIKKMVKFTISSLDTMVMDMNRVGTEEQLILIRK